MFAIHLYRSLLREASYLFDSQARRYLKHYIHKRFAVNKQVQVQVQVQLYSPDNPRHQHPHPHPRRLRALLKYARRCHSSLVKANAGHTKSTMKVMRMTYGRIGPRSHELINALLTDERGGPLVPGDKKTRPPIVTPQLKALVAQTSYAKRVVPEIPIYNISGRPFSKRREANLRWSVYHDAIRKVLPPLSEYELQRLEKLATGELVEKIPPRRIRPITPSADKDAGEKNRVRVLSEIGHHKIDLPFKKKIYRAILAECPKLVPVTLPKGRSGGWNVRFSKYKGGQMPTEGFLEEFPS